MSDSIDDAPPEFASPPCFLHEIDPAYSGLAPADDRQITDVSPRREAERKRLQPRTSPNEPSNTVRSKTAFTV